METPPARAALLISFPFSDLSRSKLRPAVVLCCHGMQGEPGSAIFVGNCPTYRSNRDETSMAEPEITQDALKQAMKEALTETLIEQRDLFRGVFYEVLEDVVLSEAIREGEETELVDREQVFETLKGQA